MNIPAFIQSKSVQKIGAIICVILLAFTLRCMFSPQKELKTLVFSGNTMGTTYHVKVVGDEFIDAKKRRLANKLKASLDFVNIHMSKYHKGGELYTLNQTEKGKAVKVSPELFYILERSLEISKQTEGAFDITVAPLVKAWGFHHKKSLQSEPRNEELAQIMASIGYEKLVLDKSAFTVTKNANLEIDLSAVAKGHAVDLLAQILDEQKEENYMVEVGGEVRCKGKNQQGQFWKIGIEEPALKPQSRPKVAKVVALNGVSLATSGDYRSYYMLNGTRVSHTLNPQTGRPISHGLASVSVITKDCLSADAFATAFTVLGLEKGKKIADKFGIATYFVQRDEKGSYTFDSSKAFSPYL